MNSTLGIQNKNGTRRPGIHTEGRKEEMKEEGKRERKKRGRKKEWNDERKTRETEKCSQQFSKIEEDGVCVGSGVKGWENGRGGEENKKDRGGGGDGVWEGVGRRL